MRCVLSRANTHKYCIHPATAAQLHRRCRPLVHLQALLPLTIAQTGVNKEEYRILQAEHHGVQSK